MDRVPGRAQGTRWHARRRGGSDSVPWHPDRGLGDPPEAFVALVSLGSPRRFLLRPHGGASIPLTVSRGNVLVMGGACLRTWEHCVPKMRHAGPRPAIPLRHPSRYEKRGAPAEGGSSDPARHDDSVAPASAASAQRRR